LKWILGVHGQSGSEAGQCEPGSQKRSIWLELPQWRLPQWRLPQWRLLLEGLWRLPQWGLLEGLLLDGAKRQEGCLIPKQSHEVHCFDSAKLLAIALMGLLDQKLGSLDQKLGSA
jgi:hypothetical protein